MASTTSEIIWLQALLQVLGFGSSQPIKMFCDNQAAIHIASNPVFHERTKHIEVGLLFCTRKCASQCYLHSFCLYWSSVGRYIYQSSRRCQIYRNLVQVGLYRYFRCHDHDHCLCLPSRSPILRTCLVSSGLPANMIGLSVYGGVFITAVILSTFIVRSTMHWKKGVKRSRHWNILKGQTFVISFKLVVNYRLKPIKPPLHGLISRIHTVTFLHLTCKSVFHRHYRSVHLKRRDGVSIKSPILEANTFHPSLEYPLGIHTALHLPPTRASTTLTNNPFWL